MKYILLILMIDNSGNEHLDRVNNITYSDKLPCLTDKAIHSKDSIIESNDHAKKSIKYLSAQKYFIRLNKFINALYITNLEYKHDY